MTYEPRDMSQPQRTRVAGSGTATPNATSGSQTVLATQSGPSQPSATLRLRAEPSPEPSRRIQWAEDVVDNEGMGKKSSKVCCIYHKPHEPGDSDSESDSDSSDDDSDSEPDLSRAQRAGGRGKRGRTDGHDHSGEGDDGNNKGKERKPSPNAYERQPKYKSKKED